MPLGILLNFILKTMWSHGRILGWVITQDLHFRKNNSDSSIKGHKTRGRMSSEDALGAIQGGNDDKAMKKGKGN